MTARPVGLALPAGIAWAGPLYRAARGSLAEAAERAGTTAPRRETIFLGFRKRDDELAAQRAAVRAVARRPARPYRPQRG